MEPGERGACYVYETCGTCRWCRAGRTTICPHRVRLGFERDGGLADHVLVSERNLVPLADSVPYAQAAVAMDAVVSPWMALHHRARIEPGERLVIAGAGGLGIHGLQIARAAGCPVAVLDPIESRLELARELGAEIAVTPTDAERLIDWAGEGVDVALESSGARAGFDVAVRCLRRGGRIVCCGYYPGVEYGVDSHRLVVEELEIMGSVSASIDAAREALEAIAEGLVETQIAERMPLEEVNEALARLRAGEVPGRIVIEL